MLQVSSLFGQSVVQFLWLLGTIIAFAVMGAVYALSGKAKRNDESFDWSRGKYPIVAMSATGAIAGVITLLTTGNFNLVVFGAALGTVGVLLDQLREMFQAGQTRYDTLRKSGVETDDAAILALRHAIEQGDIDQMQAAIANFTGHHGQPDLDNARQRSERARTQSATDGAGTVGTDAPAESGGANASESSTVEAEVEVEDPDDEIQDNCPEAAKSGVDDEMKDGPPEATEPGSGSSEDADETDDTIDTARRRLFSPLDSNDDAADSRGEGGEAGEDGKDDEDGESESDGVHPTA